MGDVTTDPVAIAFKNLDIMGQKLATFEQVMVQQGRILEEQNDGIKQLAAGVTGIMESFKMVVSNVLDIKNGIVPPEFMRIEDHQEIVRGIQDNDKSVLRQVITAMGIVLVASLGVQAVAKYLPHLFGS
jgi:hypothetical protein